MEGNTLNTNNTDICRRCHRKLKTEESKRLGFGKTCYKKYLARKRTYLFEMNCEENVMLNERDVKVFYELNSRLNPISRNIGVIGDDKKFKHKISLLNKKYKSSSKKAYNNIKIISNNTDVYRVIIQDLEYSYIKISSVNDLIGRTFRKFI